MTRAVTALVLALTLALGACVDPRSPIDPNATPPNAGVVTDKLRNRYGDVVFYYLRVRTQFFNDWVAVDFDTWFDCRIDDVWIRLIGCLD